LAYGGCGALATGLLALVLGWALIAVPEVKNFAVSPTLLDRGQRLYHARLSADEEWLLPRPLSEMGPWLPKVAVSIEDKRFYEHEGVDFLALMRAVWQNVSHGRVISGASTITVQVVRLAKPQDRTLFNKYVEFIQALKLERHLSKNEVLEIYLNRAPFGGNLRGAESAARFYFDKNARDLSLGESALLVALLRGPSVYRPDRRPELARERRDLLLDRLAAKGVATPEEVAAAKAEPVTGRRGSMPRQAWHLSEIILGSENEAWRWGQAGREYGLPTTLDMELQKFLEMRLRLGLETFPERIAGAGAVMDNASGGLLAYVGNSRWADSDAPEGPVNLRRLGLAATPGQPWVDCALARRSPGSTLKPFIYLAAFQHKGLTPASLLADTPLRLAGQAPRNFDKFYRGPVSAQVALADSLNAPAVRVLRLVGRVTALETLRLTGFKHLDDGRYYGDSLILGGCEVDMWQMLQAYGLLARQGTEVIPTWQPPIQARNLRPTRVFSAGAAWLVNECLKDDSRLPAGPRLNQEHSAGVELAFKTGTSHGLRDVWLAAYTPAHTMVLWAGDPSGRAHPGLTAINVLGPVVVPLAAALKSAQVWPGPPEEVEEFLACSVSGEPAGPHCPGRYQSFRLKSGARSHPCRVHVLQGGRVAAMWPPELAGFMAGLKPGSGPAPLARPADGPVITSPLPGGTIVLEEVGGRILLKCEGAQGMVHWYVDDEFYCSAPAGLTETLSVAPGRHKVTMMDSAGRTAGADFTVMYSQDRDQDSDLPILSF
jgi:penicillin-binding protein 1C